jgi:hypothetical protein
VTESFVLSEQEFKNAVSGLDCSRDGVFVCELTAVLCEYYRFNRALRAACSLLTNRAFGAARALYSGRSLRALVSGLTSRAGGALRALRGGYLRTILRANTNSNLSRHLTAGQH